MRLFNARLSRLLLYQQTRSLLLAPSFWITLIILSLLVGYSFVEAVALFSQASKTALSYPALARGMDPMEGIFVPTFGAYYLVETLLFPFVVIRLAGQDRQDGAEKLSLQLPLSTSALNAIKLGAVAIGSLCFLLPGVSAIIIWQLLGGDIHLPALLTLLLGHMLYALTIACLALLATVVANTPATAAIICLAATLGSWVLDFGAANGGWMAALSGFSLTTLLRQFESGLLSSQAVVPFIAMSLTFFLMASVLSHPGRKLRSKLRSLAWIMIAVSAITFLAMQKPWYVDVTEDQHHSLNPADVRALRAMTSPLQITVHLAHDDGRRYDLERAVLMKLRRLMPTLKITYAATQPVGPFGTNASDKYGLIELDYAGRHDETYSTSPSEILALIHALAGQTVIPDKMPEHRGHPLVASASRYGWWFYGALPFCFLASAWLVRRPRKKRDFLSTIGD